MLTLTIVHILLIIIAIITVYPALWVILASFRPGTSLYSADFFPHSFTLDHYRELFDKYPFGKWFFNTIKISFFTMIFSTILSTLSGYTFSKFRWRGKKNLMSGLLVLGMFPGFMSMIAVYILLLQMDLLNSHLAIIFMGSAGAGLNFLYTKGYFDTVPTSLVEAARIDGAGNFQIFWRVMLPLAKPLLVFLGLTSFAGGFTDYIFANMILRTQEKQTVAVGLYNIVSGKFATEFTIFAAGCVLVAVPITLLFMVLQRFLVEGLTSGAEKG